MYSFIFKTTRTALYTTEHCIIKNGPVEIASGSYKWQNRPWQRFQYSSAIRSAGMKLAKGAPKHIQEQFELDMERADDRAASCEVIRKHFQKEEKNGNE